MSWSWGRASGPPLGACPQDTQDYQEMFVQFGYVVLFHLPSAGCPLRLINNLIEIRISSCARGCSGPLGSAWKALASGRWGKGQGL